MMTTASWSVEQKPLWCGSKLAKSSSRRGPSPIRAEKALPREGQSDEVRFGETPKPTREVQAGLAFARYPDGCFGWQPKVRARHRRVFDRTGIVKAARRSAKLKTNDRASSWSYQMRTRSSGLR